MSADGQRTTWCRNIAENLNRLSRVYERYRRQTTDGRTTTYSERVNAKNRFASVSVSVSLSVRLRALTVAFLD